METVAKPAIEAPEKVAADLVDTTLSATAEAAEGAPRVAEGVASSRAGAEAISGSTVALLHSEAGKPATRVASLEGIENLEGIKLTPNGRPYRKDSKGRFANVHGKGRRRRGKDDRPLLLPNVDGRNVWARRARAVLDEHIADLGGDDNATAAERSIARRAAVLTTELERFELKFARAGEASDPDLDLYQRAAGNLRRLLQTLGVQRRQQPGVFGFGAMRMLEHQETMRKEAAMRERDHKWVAADGTIHDHFVPVTAGAAGDAPADTTVAAVKVEQPQTKAPPKQAPEQRAPVAGVKYEAVAAFAGPSSALRVGRLAIVHKDGGERVDDLVKDSISLAEAAALCARYGITEILENSDDQRALGRAIREERHRVLKDAEK